MKRIRPLYEFHILRAPVGAAAWLLKHISGLRDAASALIRSIVGAAVGQREHLILVEVAGTWVLLAAAPSQVRSLRAMPKGEFAATSDAPAAPPADTDLAHWLYRAVQTRRHV